MILKIDLEKAYDYLEWPFIEDTLVDAGLPSKLVSVIMKCVCLWHHSCCYGMERALKPFLRHMEFARVILSQPSCSYFVLSGWHIESNMKLQGGHGSHLKHQDEDQQSLIYFSQTIYYSLRRVL